MLLVSHAQRHLLVALAKPPAVTPELRLLAGFGGRAARRLDLKAAIL